jgi:hypothetical protein
MSYTLQWLHEPVPWHFIRPPLRPSDSLMRTFSPSDNQPSNLLAQWDNNRCGGSCGCVAAPVPQATPSIHNFVFNEALGSARRSHSMQRGGLSKRNVTGSKRFQVELTLGLNIRVYLLLRLKEAGEGGITVKARFAPSTIQNFFLLHI